MVGRYFLQIVLVAHFSTTALAVDYKLLGFQLRSTSLECQELLLKLNGTSKSCLKDRMNFQVPELTKPQPFPKEEAILVIHEMLRNVFSIFSRRISGTGWNETTVENLLATLHWQKEHLEMILEEILEEESFTWDNTTLLNLKKYYLRIVRYLKAKEYSTCAWTVVQVEILRSFFFLDRLTDYLQN